MLFMSLDPVVSLLLWGSSFPIGYQRYGISKYRPLIHNIMILLPLLVIIQNKEPWNRARRRDHLLHCCVIPTPNLSNFINERSKGTCVWPF
jgi:hypothetical protein